MEGFKLNLGFPGQYYDDETKTWNNGFRDYRADLGRYVESDPIGLMGGSNTYVYVKADPLLHADPSGLCNDCDSMVPNKPASNNLAADVSTMQSLKEFTIITGGAFIMREYATFYQNERLKGPWDFKQQGRQYADYGNFHYGVVGAAGGIPDSVLLRAAGWAQTRSGNGSPQFGSPFGGAPYGDDPADQTQIKNGIWWYRNCYATSKYATQSP